MKKRLLWAFLVLTVLFLGAVGIGWLLVGQYEKTPKAGSGALVPVNIPVGAGPLQVSEILKTHGIIEDGRSFYRYIRYYRRLSGNLKAGELAFLNNMSPEQVLQVLLEGKPYTHRITIPEGLRIDEIARLFEQAGLAEAKVFEAEAQNPSVVSRLQVPHDSLEGFLYPETYQFRKPIPVIEIFETMVKNYRQVYTPQWQKRAQELSMSELHVVTLASIVEKETGAAHERPLIAGVFHNRLRQNWRLDTDPTVIYAVYLSRGFFNGNLTRENLRMEHPYNTYRRKGLPPGPICSPGKEAIQAVLFPQSTDHMFFVSKNDGTHHFCPDLACHNRAVARYQGGG